MENTAKPIYRRILLKLSGEALQGDHLFGIDATKLSRIVQEIVGATQLGVQVALVVGGGNLIRGADICAGGIDRISADQMVCWQRLLMVSLCVMHWKENLFQ